MCFTRKHTYRMHMRAHAHSAQEITCRKSCLRFLCFCECVCARICSLLFYVASLFFHRILSIRLKNHENAVFFLIVQIEMECVSVQQSTNIILYMPSAHCKYFGMKCKEKYVCTRAKKNVLLKRFVSVKKKRKKTNVCVL